MSPIHNLQNFRARLPKPIIVEPKIPQPLSPLDTQTRNPVVEVYRLPTSPFACLDCWPSVENGTIVTWTQNQQFREPLAPDAELILEFSYDGATGIANDDHWLLVSTQPITYFLCDKVRRFRGQTIAGAYRLRIKSGDKEYVSDAIRLFQKLSFSEYRTGLKIIRAEHRLGRQSPGWLLKRRWLGVPCTRCKDLLTDMPTQDQCNICFGTGFVGGYFSPVACGMEITLEGNNDKVDSSRGPVNDGDINGRVTALYMPEQNDVWVDSVTGSRYRFVNSQVICHLHSIPLVLMTHLKHIPSSDAVYRIKVD